MYPDYALQVEMPSRYSQADAQWIQEQLRQLPVTLRQKAVLGYADAYQAAFEAESVSFRQENRGRFAANTRLRLFVGKYHKSAMGLTEKPALARNTIPTGEQCYSGA